MNKELYKESLQQEYFEEWQNAKSMIEKIKVNEQWVFYGFLGSKVKEIMFAEFMNKTLHIDNDRLCPIHCDWDIKRKKKTATINGIEVVEPIRDRLPEMNQTYFYFGIEESNLVSYLSFSNDDIDKPLLKYGWHENEEDAQLYWNTVLKPYLADYKD